MNNNIWQKRSVAMILATFCAVAWSAAYPLIKIGIQEFQIESSDVGAKTLFAGLRFFVAGIAVIAVALFQKRSFKIGGAKNFGLLFLFGLVNTAFHYFFFYIGLSNMTGSRSVIIDSLGGFILIILSCIMFKDDKFSPNKIIGCVLGFAAVLIINITPNTSLFSGISFGGDGMLLLSALSSAFGGVLTRIVTRRLDPIAATGISLSIGGALLILFGIAMGGKITVWNTKGIVILILLIAISSVSFTIYNQLICFNPVSEIAIFNSLIPILAVVMSCLFLNEPFEAKYIFAGILVTAGVYVLNKKQKNSCTK
jgi:drug/metabolite transporter (DMT)-like permease